MGAMKEVAIELEELRAHGNVAVEYLEAEIARLREVEARTNRVIAILKVSGSVGMSHDEDVAAWLEGKHSPSLSREEPRQ